MMKINRLLVLLVLTPALLFLSGNTFIVNAKDSSNWSFEIEPYIMATNIQGDTSLGAHVDGQDINIDFDDILNNLKSGAMIHAEVHHKTGWGLWLDYAYMDLEHEYHEEIAGGQVDIKATPTVRQGVLEAFGLYRQKLNSGRIDFMFGVRYWDNKLGMDLDANGNLLHNKSTTKDWIDIVFGANWQHYFSNDWSVKLRGDIGGFGLESEFTATAAIGAEYSFSKWFSLDLQYKATWVDCQEGSKGNKDYFTYDTVTFGPIVGFKFKF